MVNILKLFILLSILSQQSGNYSVTTDMPPSIAYVNKLGQGWNLGNTFDSYDLKLDTGETTWDNPAVTRELIQAIKAEGFQSIRIPLTLSYRMDSDYNLDEVYLDRYEEVVNWALDEGLYVLINIHHDSSEWLYQWDGNELSDEFIRYTAIWEQLAERFRDYGNQLFFESINEPYFEADEKQQYHRLALLNRAFQRIVRQSGGGNAERMLVLPTLLSKDSQVHLDALFKEIKQLNDAYIIASIHYYGEWEFSNNMGISLLDEVFRQGMSQRQLNDALVERLEKTFTNNGIGVLIGEYGLLGFDRHPQVNNLGETYKFIEQMNHLTRDKPVALMLWDNGQHFNRLTFEWEPTSFGDIVVQSIYGHSAYGTYIDQSFMGDIGDELFVNLTYNHLKVVSVLFNGTLMVKGDDYEVNQDGVYVYPQFFETFVEDDFKTGQVGTLSIAFNQGATWNQDVYVASEMSLEAVADLKLDRDFIIPVDYGGHQVKRVSLKNEAGAVSQHDSYLPYLTYLEDYTPDYLNNKLVISQAVFNQLDDGHYELSIETYSNKQYSYEFFIDNMIINGG